MVLSEREKKIAISVAVAGVGFLIYQFAYAPYMARVEKVEQRETAVASAEKMNSAIQGVYVRNKTVWQGIQAGGLKSDATEAETLASGAIQDWSQAARTTIASWKQERTSQEGPFSVYEAHVTVNGTTAQIARLLWSIESSTLPIRVSDVTVNSNREGTDDLTLQMSVSTLYMPPAAGTVSPKPGDKPAARPPDDDGSER